MKLIGGNISDSPVKNVHDGSAFSVGGSAGTPTPPVFSNFGSPARAFADAIQESGAGATSSSGFSYFKIKDDYWGVVYRDASNNPEFRLITFSGDTPTFQSAVDLSAKHVLAGAAIMRAVSMDNDTDLVTYSLSALTSASHEVVRWTINLSTGALSYVSKATQALVGTAANDQLQCDICKIADDHIVVTEGFGTDIRYTGLKISSGGWGSSITPSNAANMSYAGTNHQMARNGTKNQVFMAMRDDNDTATYFHLVSINTSTQALTENDTLKIGPSTWAHSSAALGGNRQLISIEEDKMAFVTAYTTMAFDLSSNTITLKVWINKGPSYSTGVAYTSPNSGWHHMGNGRFLGISSYYAARLNTFAIAIDVTNWTITYSGQVDMNSGHSATTTYAHAIIAAKETSSEVTCILRTNNDSSYERMYTLDVV
jgi:hypothetical protein